VSATLVGLVSAVGGGLVTLVGTYYARFRDEFAVRLGGLEVVKDELKFARSQINAFLTSGVLWTASYRLSPSTWKDYRSKLAAHLSRETWAEIQQLATRLEVVDRWADELRQSGAVFDHEKFHSELTDIRDRIMSATHAGTRSGTATEKLEDAIVGTRRLSIAMRLLMLVLVLGLVAAVLALVLHGSATLTTDSLARELKKQTPAKLSICDKSVDIEGTYVCALTFPKCAFKLAPAPRDPRCSPETIAKYGVNTQHSCYSAALSDELAKGRAPPKPYPWLKRLLIRFGCIKG
jgi:hypothetical protein